ncbi:hypothetical protein [Streptomyces javensis]|uniref:Uncharacterized protein n=1 Tax=Streptomyces javensis TaxID=114698 RepID=A0ABS0RPC4_9ACTN|nr:hypothetical protein [Streptomyces javensis]MBI0319110.1 hypothetical protein [Streptomyces javensis]
MTTPTAAPGSGAEWMAAERLEHSVTYAVEQLKAGKFLMLTNAPDGSLIGNAGLDPREGREWLTRHCESGVRAWT